MQLPSYINKFLCKPEDLTLLFSPKNKIKNKKQRIHLYFCKTYQIFVFKVIFFGTRKYAFLPKINLYTVSIFLIVFGNFYILFVLCLNKMCIQLRFLVYIKQAIWLIILYFFLKRKIGGYTFFGQQNWKFFEGHFIAYFLTNIWFYMIFMWCIAFYYIQNKYNLYHSSCEGQDSSEKRNWRINIWKCRLYS